MKVLYTHHGETNGLYRKCTPLATLSYHLQDLWLGDEFMFLSIFDKDRNVVPEHKIRTLIKRFGMDFSARFSIENNPTGGYTIKRTK